MQTISTEFQAALVKARSKMESVRKGSFNPAFKNKYADISDILDEVVPPLLESEIFMATPLHNSVGCVGASIELRYKAELLVVEPFFVKPEKDTPQGYVGAGTYAKRTVLTSYWTLPTEDDDGNTASGVKPQQQQAPRPAQQATPVPPKQIEAAPAVRLADEEQFKRFKRISEEKKQPFEHVLGALTYDQYTAGMTHLKTLTV